MSEQLSDRGLANLSIDNITISRMAGIRDEYRIDSLSPGVNLIHGPNGIGKSRTALALQTLIWPSLDSDRSSLIGNLTVAGNTWNVELENGKSVFQRSGSQVPGFHFAVPPASQRDRYLLTLQDLLRVDNKNFAIEIQKQASGGYDLGQIRTAIGISASTKRYRPSKPDKPLRDIRSEIHDLRLQEEKLQDQEASLQQLKSQHKDAIDASKRLTELEAARRYQRACEDLEAASVALNYFPPAVSSMLGEEFNQAENLGQSLTNEKEEQRKCSSKISTLEEQFRGTGLPQNIHASSVMSILRNRLKDVQQQEAEIRQSESQIREKADRIEKLRNRLKQDISEQQMESLDTSGLGDLAKLSQEWQRAQNTIDIQNELHNWLGDSVDWNRESFRSGMELLSRYHRILNDQNASGQKRMIIISLIAAAIIIVFEAVLLVYSLSQYALLLALLAVPLIWLALRSKADSTAVELEQIQSQYSSLDLIEPANWTSDEVFRSLMNIHEMTAKAELEHERAVRWSSLHDLRQKAASQLQAIEQERESYTQTYGIDLVEAVPENLTSLNESLEEWRRETSLRDKSQSQKSALESIRASTLARIRQDLQSYGMKVDIQDSIGAEAAVEELGRRISVVDLASAELGLTRQRLEQEVSPRRNEIEAQLAAIFTDVGLELNDFVELKGLCDQVEPCSKALRAFEHAEILVDRTRLDLRKGTGDENLDQNAIDDAMSKEAGIASQRDDLQANISRITAEIDQAQRQTRMEMAVARETAALDILSEGRQQDYASATDQLVFNLIQNRDREENRPPVFRAANQLFISFTNGAYRLGLDEESYEFTAVEAETDRSLTLEKLSSGTRVQLLLAIRLAFIEVSEQGTRLPLIMDETLGNTDDNRAKTIIDATIEIAGQGRQVIYFTAQHDEISKWSAALSSLDNPFEWEVIDLDSIRRKSHLKSIPAHTWNPSTFSKIEVSEDADRNSLLDPLNVAPIDIRTAQVEEIDLWYLVPEVSALISLRNRGVQRWGQYLNLHNGSYLQGVWNESLHEKAIARAQVVEAFLTAWREGRPDPLTVEDLNSSGLITPRYWDEVVGCAKSNSWEAAALIRALEIGTISGFRRNVIEALFDWLSNNGFITDAEPLEEATIRARVISSLNESIEKGLIFVQEIDELLIDIVGEQEPENYIS